MHFLTRLINLLSVIRLCITLWGKKRNIVNLVINKQISNKKSLKQRSAYARLIRNSCPLYVILCVYLLKLGMSVLSHSVWSNMHAVELDSIFECSAALSWQKWLWPILFLTPAYNRNCPRNTEYWTVKYTLLKIVQTSIFIYNSDLVCSFLCHSIVPLYITVKPNTFTQLK